MTRTELVRLINESKKVKESRLNKCSAYVVLAELQNGRAVDILKSYDTLVAVFSRRTGTLYVFNYYSVTTYKHIYKFASEMSAERITWLYERSDRVVETRLDGSVFKLPRQELQNLKKFDYAMEIETFK